MIMVRGVNTRSATPIHGIQTAVLVCMYTHIHAWCGLPLTHLRVLVVSAISCTPQVNSCTSETDINAGLFQHKLAGYVLRSAGGAESLCLCLEDAWRWDQSSETCVQGDGQTGNRCHSMDFIPGWWRSMARTSTADPSDELHPIDKH